MYWIAKEETPNKKFTSLLAVLQQLEHEDIKYFKHRSGGSIRALFLLIGSVLKAQFVDDISRTKCFGLLIDDVCDVSNKEQLVAFVRFVHPETGKAKTALFASSSLLENSSSADALVAQVEDAGIDKRKLASFSSDGASVVKWCTVYLLQEVLPILGHLSKTFQQGEVCLASIAPAIEYTADRLDEVGQQREHLARLKKDLFENGRLQICELPIMSPDMEEQLKNLIVKHVDALKENIENRFEGNLKVLTAFRVFDLTAVPKKNEVGFKQKTNCKG